MASTIQQIIFIDPRVPDIEDLLKGLQVGELGRVDIQGIPPES